MQYLYNTKESGYCYRVVPVGCLKKPYELKECPRDIADLDWPESKKQKENQDLWDWTSEINSADWTICHVRIAHRIPIVICDHLIQGMTLSNNNNIIETSCKYIIFYNYRRRAMLTFCFTDQAKLPIQVG